ncbi:MAG TPA: sulfatase-like hydrolase/transferase [Thermoanaerobaculia bacterium]|nr:sulfatase-like hydrolase/transferase [Thermoanaerobaculia bacterium]
MRKKPNVLMFMVDEMRYPTPYDGPVLREWMDRNLPAQKLFRERGVEFHRHYAQSAACAPSRTSIFTGQYPTLHGVSQTDGIGKTAWDPGMSWLDPNTVPTMGDWFRAAGYETYYKGKWHISHADIEVPGTKSSLMTTVMNDKNEGRPILENIDIYRNADRLDGFGFSGWIGPEPHGRNPANSGWVRDAQYRHEALALLDALEERESDAPWLFVNSYVNPHDIVFFGVMWASFGFPYPSFEQVPPIPEPPTQNEDLSTKPTAQASYVTTYGQMFLPQPPVDLYRRFYYYLQAVSDQYILEVYRRLERSRFFENTIIVFTSDHGDTLGAHGGMHQKWYQAYEETIHVPFIISGPLVEQPGRSEFPLTSHADLVPTLLGLCDIDVDEAAKKIIPTHSETRELVGRDLSSVVRGTAPVKNEPVFFMTYDNVSQGLSQITNNRTWNAVATPNQVETVIAEIDGEIWKYSRYAQDQPTPYAGLVTNQNILDKVNTDGVTAEEFEMYNVSCDPYEQTNLCWPANETVRSKEMLPKMQALLDEQKKRKCLVPIVNQGEPRIGGEGELAALVPDERDETLDATFVEA